MNEVTLNELVQKLVDEGGCLVSSADCGETEIISARARRDLYVDSFGFGFVRRLPQWLRKHSRFARKAEFDNCEIKSETPPDDEKGK